MLEHIIKSLTRRASSSFKHNASFVARLPTIRRHKSQSLHSPGNQKPPAGSARGRVHRINDMNTSAENLGESFCLSSLFLSIHTKENCLSPFDGFTYFILDFWVLKLNNIEGRAKDNNVFLLLNCDFGTEIYTKLLDEGINYLFFFCYFLKKLLL